MNFMCIPPILGEFNNKKVGSMKPVILTPSSQKCGGKHLLQIPWGFTKRKYGAFCQRFYCSKCNAKCIKPALQNNLLFAEYVSDNS